VQQTWERSEVLVEDVKKRDHLIDIGIDKRIILKLIIKN
jgi:hypothetical protein